MNDDHVPENLSYESNKWSSEECDIKRRLGIIESSRIAYIIFSSIMFGMSLGYHEFPRLQFGIMVFAIIGYIGGHQLNLRIKRIKSSIAEIENTVAGDDGYQSEKHDGVIRAVWSLKKDALTSCWVFWKIGILIPPITSAHKGYIKDFSMYLLVAVSFVLAGIIGKLVLNYLF